MQKITEQRSVFRVLIPNRVKMGQILPLGELIGSECVKGRGIKRLSCYHVHMKKFPQFYIVYLLLIFLYLFIDLLLFFIVAIIY